MLFPAIQLPHLSASAITWLAVFFTWMLGNSPLYAWGVGSGVGVGVGIVGVDVGSA